MKCNDFEPSVARNCDTLAEFWGARMAAPALPSARVLRFESFELDVRAGELRKRGVKLRLQGQPIQLLAILLQSAGNLVTREELRSQLWPADTFVDFDHSLHNSIGRIREVLGDSAETPRYIETLPRRGYRFIAPVVQVPAPQIAAGSGIKAVEPPEIPKRPKWNPRLIFALGSCCVIALATWLAWQRFHVKPAPASIHSIAVLPLKNYSADPGQEYFADGMTEELITELSSIQGLKVISHTSVAEYKGTQKHLPQIARELGVDGVVEGSVIREGDQVRVTVQLLDAPNDRHIWSEAYQREMRGILNLQREIAQSIAQQVRLQLTIQQQARVRSGRPVNPEAYEAYLRGRSLITTDVLTPQALRSAQGYFEEAIRKDPGFALGYAGLADCYLYLTIYDQLPHELGYGQAQAAVRKALELDDSIGEAHATLGMLRWKHDWDWAGAERELNNAIALTPNFGCAHLNLAYYLSWRGRRAEALAELAKSRELDPNYNFDDTEADIYYQARDYPALVELSRRALASNPDDGFLYAFLGMGYQGTGKRAEAIPEYQKVVAMSNGDPHPSALLASAYAVSGRRPEAEKLLRDLERKSKVGYVSPYLIATVYAALGDKDKAFQFLEKAYQERSGELTWDLRADSRIDNLRSDPRFEGLVRRIGLPQ
jgi:TolB-like protein/DNA-binding winged helix-turn-helix (wHTH) protein/Flp pilus assembly protein TadD